MDIVQRQITIGELTDGYADKGEDGVFAYGGKLSVRPPYQREFVYKDRERNAVIDTVLKGFPLNVMYWSRDSEGGLEVLDGQQRTISICSYVHGDYSIPFRGEDTYFSSLPSDVRDRILQYRLFIYECTGDESEKLEWFRTINIAGEKLTEQELRNAAFTGPWLADAKRHFSKNGCPAFRISENYVNKSPIRQELLETAIDWISDGNVSEYMSKHQHDSTCSELWLHFKAVIAWVENTFRSLKYREMRSVDWGRLYCRFHNDPSIDPETVTSRTVGLMADDEIQKKSGIFEYVLSGDEKCLNLRTFRPHEKRTAYERQGGICPICGEHFGFDEMEGDHIVPWSKGGKTEPSNLQMLCRKCNREKSSGL